MRRLALLSLLALSGCATTRYVTTYCVSRDQYEQLKKAAPDKIHDRLTGQADSDILVITANAIRLRAYSDGLLEVLGGCQDPKGTTK